ncbi:MAG: hypothetical protein U0V75_06900 [Ferruginibacter sp.]
MPLSFKNIQPYLSTHQHKASRWLSYFGLCIGVILLLCSIQLFININLLLKDKNPKRTGFDFVSVTKVITNENMASDNRFTEPDIKEIQSQPFIEGAAPLIANQFRVKASAGNIIPFSTDLFVESLDNAFIDTVPPVFSWKEGQTDVPIIFSADFLEMYNVFAPGQDLPQLSAETISSVNIILECYGPGGMESYRGHIVALSDRINSVLVPESFMQMANQRFGGVKNVPASRIYVKTKDANNPELLNFIAKKNYHINKDKTRFGRIKQILQAIVSGLGGFGVLVILLAMVLFAFYLQLVIAKSRENLQLLLVLGYSPGWLSKTVAKKWIPVYISIIGIAVIITALLHAGFRMILPGNGEALPVLIHWIVLLTAAVLVLLSAFINYRLIKKLLLKIQ